MVYMIGYIICMINGLFFIWFGYKKSSFYNKITSISSVICLFIIMKYYSYNPLKFSGGSIIYFMNMIILLLSTSFLSLAYLLFHTMAPYEYSFGAAKVFSGLGMALSFFVLLQNAGNRDNICASFILVHCILFFALVSRLKRKI
jgi:hypothetical protein